MHNSRDGLESSAEAIEGVEELLVDNIPGELKAEKAWVVWKREYRDGKPTKVLYQVNGKRADSTDHSTWTTFEDAVNAYQQDDRLDGIGFVFHEGNPYCGADIDDATEDQARRWIDLFDSYTERSPSGNGFHIICKAKLPKGTNRPEGELYSSGRFFTVTGAVVHDAPIREAQAAADEFYEYLRRGDTLSAERAPATSPAFTDAEVVRRAENAKNGAEFRAVYRGGGQFKSKSERDLSLARRIAFYTQDEAQIERIMRGSGCKREKWDKHRTYLRDTIAKALSGKTASYSPPRHRPRNTRVDKEFEDLVRGDGKRPANMPYNTTDMGNAERLVARHGQDLRYIHAWRKWLAYDGTRWRVDDTGEVGRRAKETTRSIYGEAEKPEYAELRKQLAQHAINSEARSRVEAMVVLAESEPGIPVRPEDLDKDPWLLNVENGTVELRTGELREHRREDLITKLAPVEYDPDAEAPTWEAVLERLLPSPELRRFFQRFVGYCLTGDTSEQVLVFLHGLGGNGKSTIINALLDTLGEYGKQAAPELLTVKASSHPTELADLKGARLVASIEVEEGKRLAESLVKQLTGGDRIKARRMREDFWEFEATHKLLLAANHKPVVRGADHAIWRRIKLVPFDVTIPEHEKDKKLPEMLRAERSGILAWAVRGCLDWRENGLGEPEEVRVATDAYRAEMDVLAAFMEERCVLHEDAHADATPLYDAYKGWCTSAGENPETQTRFGSMLRERGFRAGRDPKTRRKVWYGIGLFTHNGPDDGGGVGPENPAPDGPDPKQSKRSETVETISPREAHKTPGKQNNRFEPSPTVSQDAVGDLGKTKGVSPEVAAYLADPPKDLLRQAERCAAEGGTTSQLFTPLVASVAYGAFGTVAGRRDEVRPTVEAWIRDLLERSRAD